MEPSGISFSVVGSSSPDLGSSATSSADGAVMDTLLPHPLKRVSMLSENESIYLPLGCVHRLANPGKILLEVIEVQTGSYRGEDDIIRIEDEFGRA